MYSTTNTEVGNLVAKYSDREVILIDINDSPQAESMCHDIIYLVEPSIIKLNKMITMKPDILNELKNKTVILNISLLDLEEVKDFEMESRLSIFFNMPPLDDHKISEELNELLKKLGFSKQ